MPQEKTASARSKKAEALSFLHETKFIDCNFYRNVKRG